VILPTAAASVRIFFIRASGLNGFPSAEAFNKRYISARVPLNQLVAAVDEKARAAIVADVNLALAQYEDETGLNLPTAVNVVTARA
jgi:hypothetical protein